MTEATKKVLFESVLLIEDDLSHAYVIRRALKAFCKEITHTETLSAALEALSKTKFDIIVTDLHLSDSHEVTNIRKLKEGNEVIPVLVLTASTSLKDAVEAMKLGADDFIVKDFGPDFNQILAFSLSRIFGALELRLQKQKLEREMEALRTAIENSADGLAVSDGYQKVVYSNSAYRDFVAQCGGDSTTLQKLFAEPVVNAQSVNQTFQERLASLSPGSVWHTEVALQKTTRQQAFDVSLSVIRAVTRSHVDPPEGSFCGNECVIWVRDISEVKRREKFQREILSTTTHDLKGPLGAILISSELLRDMSGDPKKVSDLSLRVNSAAQSAINLIDEFLSARRIQEGTFILKPSSQDIEALIQRVTQGFQALAEAKSITISILESGHGITWKLDNLGFERVISNLLSNAIKFTPKGGTITISAFERAGTLQIQVKDSGCGMEPAEVQKVFERFSRLEKHSGVPGTGLGLFVVKAVVTAHGGSIEVTSQPDKGTMFDIALPSNPPVNDRGELICLDFA